MRIPPASVLAAAALSAALGAAALAQQGRQPPMMAHGKPVPPQLRQHAAGAPPPPPLSDFKGYQGWQTVAVHQTEEQLKLIVANPVMMSAYRQGLPADGKKFPEGSRIAKIEWSRKNHPTAPYPVFYPGELAAVAFIEKDSKRFPKTNGWGYSEFIYDPAAKALKPSGKGSDCGHACHTRVASQDFIFTNRPTQPPP